MKPCNALTSVPPPDRPLEPAAWTVTPTATLVWRSPSVRHPVPRPTVCTTTAPHMRYHSQYGFSSLRFPPLRPADVGVDADRTAEELVVIASVAGVPVGSGYPGGGASGTTGDPPRDQAQRRQPHDGRGQVNARSIPVARHSVGCYIGLRKPAVTLGTRPSGSPLPMAPATSRPCWRNKLRE